jgi:hypothetical protein
MLFRHHNPIRQQSFASISIPILITMRFILLIGLCLCWASCATLFNSPNTAVYVRSAKGTQVTVDCVTKTIPVKGAETFVVNRSPDSLLITLTKDSIVKEVKIKSLPSRTGYFNVFNLGLGFLKDRKSLERYTYPKMLWIPVDEPGNSYYTQNPARKRMWGLHITVPMFNSVYYRFSSGKDQVEVLPFGFTFGLNYGTSPYNYWSFEAGGSMNFDIMENFSDTVTEHPHFIAFANVRKNHLIGAFTLGYGLEVSYYHWESYDMVRNGSERIKTAESIYRTTGAGPVFAAYFSPGILAVGIKYHTQFLSYNNQLMFRYGHIISLEAQLSFPLKRKFLYN